MTRVDPRIEKMLLEGGYTCTGNSGSGKRYVNGGNTALVSGYMLLVRSEGIWRPFPVEYAVKVGIRILERLARLIPHGNEGKEETTGYELGIGRRCI